MRRRFLIILVIVILVGAGVWFLYLRPRQTGVSPLPAVITNFFPKAKTDNTGAFGTDSSVDTTTTTAAKNPLQQVTAHAVAGYTIFSLNNTLSIPSAVDPKAKPTVVVSTDHYIRYVSRQNGYVYEIKNGTTAMQVTNVFIPNIYEAYFADGGNTALLRFLRDDDKTIATYSVPVPPLNPDSTRTQKPGIYLSDNIFSMTVSPDQKSVVRITTDKNGAIISTSSSTGASVKTILHNAFTEWLPQWTTSGIYLQTKSASVADSYFYFLDQSKSRLQRIVGDVAGMTTSVSPDGVYVLYSQSTSNGFLTKLFNTKTNATTSINLAILPEKCDWLQNDDLMCAGNTSVPSGTYPDDWYAGTVHFSDQLYDITPSSGTYTTIYNGSDASFDMTNIQVDEGQRYVYFIDKNTGLLWQYGY